jgi:hypothetical protein
MKRSVSVRGALIKSPRCSANPTTCGPISLWRFTKRDKAVEAMSALLKERLATASPATRRWEVGVYRGF